MMTFDMAPQWGQGRRSGLASSASLMASGRDAQSSRASSNVMSNPSMSGFFPSPSTWTYPGYLPVYSALTLSPRISP